MAKVSIIIPCHNQGRYLVRALESVLGQEYREWEAIVVDDGSTDDTAAIANRFEDSRVVYNYQENGGLPAARNSGLAIAEGQYLAFLDADDEWELSFLTRCVETLEASPETPGVYSGSRFIDEDGRRLPQISNVKVTPKAFRRRILEGGFFPPHAAMVRREALKISGLFDTTLRGRGLEDWDLWLRLSTQGPMIGIAEPLARYRVHAGSMSTDAERMQENRLAVLKKHFGPAIGEVTAWKEEKRYAYAFAHRTAGLAFLQQGQPSRCWSEMDKAAKYWPPILERLDTYYELGCGGQPKGHRGWPEPAEILGNGAMILDWLNSQSNGDRNKQLRGGRRAMGQAYLALAMLAERAGDWRLGRYYMRQAMKNDRNLVGDGRFIRRLVKLHLGKQVSETTLRLSGKRSG